MKNKYQWREISTGLLLFDACPKTQFELIHTTGTGTNPSSTNPLTLTFTKAPSIIAFVGTFELGSSHIGNGKLFSFYGTNSTYGTIKTSSLTTSFANKLFSFTIQNSASSTYSSAYFKKSTDGKVISYYTSDQPDSSNSGYKYFNYLNNEYYWLGII